MHRLQAPLHSGMQTELRSRLKTVTPAILLALMLSFMLTSCAGKQIEQVSGIGPYSHVQGRLLVIEPARRWQAMIDWQATQIDEGSLRLTHAATGTVVEFQWRGEQMLLRSNSDPLWRDINRQQLAAEGIVIPPQELAAILLGRMPRSYRSSGINVWENHDDSQFIRVEWQADAHKLTLTDIRHGRVATLLIQP